MEYRTLIKHGTVVDGSGRAAYRSDVRIHGGRIVEIGRDLSLASGEREIDARD
jgi:N-acyl-D-amino-acid deacylase